MGKCIRIYADACASKVGGGVGLVVVEDDVKIAEGSWFDSTCKDAELAKDMEFKAFNLALSLAKGLTKKEASQIIIYSDNNVVIKEFKETARTKAKVVTKKEDIFMFEADKLSRLGRKAQDRVLVEKISLNALKEMSKLSIMNTGKDEEIIDNYQDWDNDFDFAPIEAKQLLLSNVSKYLEIQIKASIKDNNAEALGIHIEYFKVLVKDGVFLPDLHIDCVWKDIKSMELAYQLGRLRELIFLNVI